jgi:hypothetical protein
VLNYFSAILSVIAIEVMRRTQGWNNLQLLFLLLSIFIYSGSNVIYIVAFLYGKNQFSFWNNFFFIAGGDFCHWIITMTYIQASFETKMLLKKDTYLKSAHELVLVDKVRCLFTITNAVISLLILLVSITYSFGLNFRFYRIANWAYNANLVF